MSADFSSSNPFRRRDPQTPPLNPSLVNHIAYQQADPQPGLTGPERKEAPKKVTKSVRIQSPPPPSPSVPDSASTVGEENYSIFTTAPTPPTPSDDDPFESVTSDASEDEAIHRPSLSKAPANPFSKTLETMEHPEREKPVVPSTTLGSPGRASMDVDAFKRLLLTGNTGIAIPTVQPGLQAHAIHALGDGGSSTDASSISRQSIFEAIQEPHPESPRTSHEISEPDDERRQVSGEGTSTTGRKPPPPPSSRHGKMIRVELRDEPPSEVSSIPSQQSPPALGSPFTSTNRYSLFGNPSSSQTDLNKPLPPPPSRTSHDSERESVFDKESLGRTPEPPSPSSSTRKKTAPAPPLSRRHSQMVSESKLSRSSSGRLSPKVEEDIPSKAMATVDPNRPRSDSGSKPPPPPSRRPGSIRNLSHNNNTLLSSPSTVSLPPPPPTRGTSNRRPPSVHSVDIALSSPNNTTNKRASFMPPPPPPPHRHGRSSTEAQTPPNTSRRTSVEQPRRSLDRDSIRRGSAASSVIALQENIPGPPERTVARSSSVSENEAAGAGNITESSASAPQRHDILADLTKLQREIDALRVQSGREKQGPMERGSVS